MQIILNGEKLTTEELYKFGQLAESPDSKYEISICPEGIKRIQASEAFVQEVVKDDKAVYGINTGFGRFSEVKISNSELEELQTNIIRSHACGVGTPLSRSTTLAMWIVRLNVFARGHSGIRIQTLNTILAALNKGFLADIPSRGSVGASGDLCPSAHAVLAHLGEGSCTYVKDGKIISAKAADALKDLDVKKLELGPKEGLALINGTQLTSVLATFAIEEMKALLKVANLSTALMIEGLRGAHTVLDDKILQVKNQKGILAAGREMRAWLGDAGTEISKSHENCGRVQDAYSLRCAALVHGAIHDELLNCEEILNGEINSSSDNPLLFAETKESLSCGNFHALYPARVSDRIASAAATLASISERRTALAMNAGSSQLPTFLVKNGGLHSGFMMIHVTAAALVSEAKSNSFPASVDSIPTNDDKEDHVSMGPTAGYKALHNIKLLRDVLAIEVMTACQAIDLLRPLKSSPQIERVVAKVRRIVPLLEKDRSTSEEIAKLSANLESMI
ncbi:MAG: histidine ammonia-lyase [Bdellovibrionota bacterium]